MEPQMEEVRIRVVAVAEAGILVADNVMRAADVDMVGMVVAVFHTAAVALAHVLVHEHLGDSAHCEKHCVAAIEVP